jgi:hypothetical protein
MALPLGFGRVEGRLAGRGTSVGPGRLFVRLHERAPARAAMDPWTNSHDGGHRSGEAATSWTSCLRLVMRRSYDEAEQTACRSACLPQC